MVGRSKVECPNCGWDWEIESDDDRPYLCHKCGYDTTLNDFDIDALDTWKKNNKLPFKESVLGGKFIRVFSEDTDEAEFMWHMDKEDRLIKSLTKTNWLIQLDNQLPQPLTEEIFIPKGVYHRLLKGTGDLTIELKKL